MAELNHFIDKRGRLYREFILTFIILTVILISIFTVIISASQIPFDSNDNGGVDLSTSADGDSGDLVKKKSSNYIFKGFVDSNGEYIGKYSSLGQQHIAKFVDSESGY